MSKLTTIGWGHDQFRVGPWNADNAVAYLALPTHVLKPTVQGIQRALDTLSAQGYRGVTTSALRPAEVAPFMAAGFQHRERLIILSHPLRPSWNSPQLDRGTRIRRAVRRDRGAVVDLDRRAFVASWQLDTDGLGEALRATPSVWFRVAVGPTGIIGYAVCGRAGTTGYLQRLAVSPEWSGQGIGRALLADALRWAVRRSCVKVLVNTQEENHRALQLYQQMGFSAEPFDMVVLERSLP